MLADLEELKLLQLELIDIQKNQKIIADIRHYVAENYDEDFKIFKNFKSERIYDSIKPWKAVSELFPWEHHVNSKAVTHCLNNTIANRNFQLNYTCGWKQTFVGGHHTYSFLEAREHTNGLAVMLLLPWQKEVNNNINKNNINIIIININNNNNINNINNNININNNNNITRRINKTINKQENNKDGHVTPKNLSDTESDSDKINSNKINSKFAEICHNILPRSLPPKYRRIIQNCAVSTAVLRRYVSTTTLRNNGQLFRGPICTL